MNVTADDIERERASLKHSKDDQLLILIETKPVGSALRLAAQAELRDRAQKNHLDLKNGIDRLYEAPWRYWALLIIAALSAIFGAISLFKD